jgi:hypothetical protein
MKGLETVALRAALGRAKTPTNRATARNGRELRYARGVDAVGSRCDGIERQGGNAPELRRSHGMLVAYAAGGKGGPPPLHPRPGACALNRCHFFVEVDRKANNPYDCVPNRISSIGGLPCPSQRAMIP